MINIDIITENYSSFTQKDTTLFAMVFIFSGLIGCFISGYILSKKPRFKDLAIVTATFHFLSYVAFVATLEYYQNDILTSFEIGLVGFFNICVQPISMEFAAETTFPVSETYSAGVLLLSSQLFSIIINVWTGHLMDDVGMD